MNLTALFTSGFFTTLGVLCALLAFGVGLMMVILLTETMASIVRPEPPVTQFHLHTEGEDNQNDQHNDHNRFPRN